MPGFELTAKQATVRDQLAGRAKHHLLYGGSRSGKTFVICYAIARRAVMAPGSRHGIFRRHGVAAKHSIGKDTFPKMWGLIHPEIDLKWHEQDGYFSTPHGSEVWLAGLDDKERVDKVLGKEFATIYTNEASEVAFSSYTVLQTRLAQKATKANGQPLPLRDYVDLNPTTRAHWTYRLWVDGINPDGEREVDRSDYAVAVMNPGDNAANLAPDYIASLEALPERQRRRFFLGEYTSDAPNALWRRAMFRRTQARPEELDRIVIAIDPAVSDEIGSDETGVIAVGVDAEGTGYVLEDASGRYQPEEWARQAVALYDYWQADRIVAEKNQGGDMVEAVLRARRADLPYTGVTASRGKVTRAEPVAALYERGKVVHVGRFDALEEQMCSMTTAMDRKAAGWSPDRVDALVWGFTALFPQMTRREDEAKWTPPPWMAAAAPSSTGWMGE